MKSPMELVRLIVIITPVAFHDLPLFPSSEPRRVITHPKKTPSGNQIMSEKFERPPGYRPHKVGTSKKWELFGTGENNFRPIITLCT